MVQRDAEAEEGRTPSGIRTGSVSGRRGHVWMHESKAAVSVLLLWDGDTESPGGTGLAQPCRLF